MKFNGDLTPALLKALVASVGRGIESLVPANAERDALKALLYGRCEFPGCTCRGFPRRQNTAYERLIQNWRRYCIPHQKEADEHWASMWKDYYANVL